MRIAPLTAALLAACVTVAAAGPTATEPAGQRFRRDEFNSLALQSRILLVQAALDRRDQDLGNFDYAVDESHTNFSNRDGHSTFLFHEAYECKRLKTDWWMHLTSYKWHQEGADVRAEVEINWLDGVSRTKDYPPYFRTAYFQGSIKSHENDNVSIHFFNELLGLRMFDGAIAKPTSQWLRDSVALKKRIDVSMSDFDGVPAVHVVVTSDRDYETKQLWLDPARGFMIDAVQFNFAKDGRYNKYLERVLKSTETDGIWIPTMATRRVGTSASDVETEITYSVKSFVLGTVSKDELAISYPVGSKIYDEIRGALYFIQPDGKFKLLPMANAHTQEVFVPREKVLSRMADAGPPLYITEPFPQPPPKAVNQIKWFRATVIVGGISAVAWSILSIRRRRVPESPDPERDARSR